MKSCLLFHSNLLPRWLETYYFLSLDEAEFDGRWADCIPSLDSLIGDKYLHSPFQQKEYTFTTPRALADLKYSKNAFRRARPACIPNQ